MYIISNAMEQLNNREIAVGIWLLIGIGLVLILKSKRSAAMDVLRAALNPKLVILFAIFAAYASVLTWIFSRVGLLTSDQFMATFLWYFLPGLGILFDVFQTEESDRYFRKLVIGSFSAMGAFEFVFAFYTFHLAVEILLVVPITAILGVILAFSKRRQEHKEVHSVAQWILTVIVIVYVTASAWRLIDDPGAFFTASTARNFILPIILTIGTIPFYYALLIYLHIEKANIYLNLKNFQSEELKRYAKRRFVMAFMFRPWLLNRAARQFYNLSAETNAEVDKIVEDIFAYERNKKHPPIIDPTEGWCPYASQDFLAGLGLRTNDYHEEAHGEEEYFAGSKSIEIDDPDPASFNTVTFYIEGEKEVVKTLKLKGRFYDKPPPNVAVSQFREIAIELVMIGEGVNELTAKLLVSGSKDSRIPHNATTIQWLTERLPTGRGFEVYFTLSR